MKQYNMKRCINYHSIESCRKRINVALPAGELDVQNQEVTVFSGSELSVTLCSAAPGDIGGERGQRHQTHTYTHSHMCAHTYTHGSLASTDVECLSRLCTD